MRSILTQNLVALKNTCRRYLSFRVHFSDFNIDNSNLSVFTIDHHQNPLDKLALKARLFYLINFFEMMLARLKTYNSLFFKKRFKARAST
ncbi:MAG TPA: hypothetical protein VIL26_03700 [Clostridia bacterium]